MRVLNVILVLVLIAYTVYNFAIINSHNKTVIELNDEIKLKQETINKLMESNNSIDSVNTILLDSILIYKRKVIEYNDSIIKIKRKYVVVNKEVSQLSDSMSVIYFNSYLSKYTERFSSDSD